MHPSIEKQIKAYVIHVSDIKCIFLSNEKEEDINIQ